jgi:hypothetical protein
MSIVSACRWAVGLWAACALAVAYAMGGAAENADPGVEDWAVTFGPGTLAYHLATNAVARARGFNGSYGDRLVLENHSFANYSGTNLAYLTNSTWARNSWLAGVRGLSATCIGFSNGLGGQGLMTMVSPRHGLFATHMGSDRYLAAFLGTNNVIYWRTTLKRIDLTNDTSVGILNADLPPAVGFLPVLPADYAQYLPATAPVFVQGLGMNQDILVFSQPMTFGYPGFVVWNSTGRSLFGLATNWNFTIRGGDSSDPEMLLIHNQLVLVSHNYGVKVGPNYVTQMDAINAAMHKLSVDAHARTDYQLTPYSLAEWRVITGKK